MVAFAVTVACFYGTITENASKAKSDRLEAIGGIQAYRAGRRSSLFRLLDHADGIPDPVMREREKARIEEMIRMFEDGQEGTEEMGSELTIERFGNGGVSQPKP